MTQPPRHLLTRRMILEFNLADTGCHTYSKDILKLCSNSCPLFEFGPHLIPRLLMSTTPSLQQSGLDSHTFAAMILKGPAKVSRSWTSKPHKGLHPSVEVIGHRILETLR